MKSESTVQQVSFRQVQNINDLEIIHASYLNYTFPRHLHEEYVIGIIVQGVEEISHGGKIYAAPAGSLILINPGEPHSNYSIDNCGFAYRMFYPPADLLRQINFGLSGKAELPLFSTPVIQQSDLFHALLSLHIQLERKGSALEQESAFVAVMSSLIIRHSLTVNSFPLVSGKYSYVKTAREYLEAYYKENFSLRDLASIAGVSPYHLLRNFHDEIGLPPFQYQTQLRISHVKKLLRSGWSIADAAAETGFVDQSHLTKHFKRVVSVTPGKYSLDRNKIQ